jgi:hypothetical protein
VDCSEELFRKSGSTIRHFAVDKECELRKSSKREYVKIN